MYAKVFASIYDGTLADHWQALVTFQQLLILATADGVVDLSPTAIARKTGIPMEIITAGIEHLEKPDPHSRTPDLDGRRIARLDEHRTWGWFIVNHKFYRDQQSKAEKREADRRRVATKRAEARQAVEQSDSKGSPRQDATGCDTPRLSSEVADVAYVDVDRDIYNNSVETYTQEPSREPEQPPSVCVGELSRAGIRVSPAAAISIALRQRGVMIPSSHPDVIAAADEGVTAEEAVAMHEAYPSKPGPYLIAAARRIHAEPARALTTGPPGHARTPTKSRYQQGIENMNRLRVDDRGNITYDTADALADARDTLRVRAIGGPGA